MAGEAFKPSENVYDWLGFGIYFWEANPMRGLGFANEAMARRGSKIKKPTVIGAVIDLGDCLDLLSSASVELVRIAYDSLIETLEAADKEPPNNKGRLHRPLDCAVIEHLHGIYESTPGRRFDSVRAAFTEGNPVYPDAGFDAKTHIQIAVRTPACIKGVFRVPPSHLTSM